jgi:hypothetical protein
MSLAAQLSGFLFLFIIVDLILCDILGFGIDSDLNSEAKLQKINADPQKFKITFFLLLLENITIFSLAIMLFIAFSPINMMLGVIWAIFRITESLIQIYDKKNYWRLLNIAEEYSNTPIAERTELINLGHSILKTKLSIFMAAQIFFSIGTLAYSILFATYEVVPVILGWIGIVASIIYGLGNGAKLIKPNFDTLWNVGGLLVLVFELGLGGWLLVFG